MKKLIMLGLGIGVLLGVMLFQSPPVQNVLATQIPQSDGCDHSCPVVHFEWQTTVYDNCPSGYSVRSGHSDQCRKNTYPFTVIDRPSHKVDHEADVAYEKSQDPNKCHRPSDNTLEDVYGMDHDARHDFKEANSEWMDSKDVVPEGYYHEEGACYPKVEVCTDDSALNYGGEDGKFDEEKETSNNELCKYPEEEPTDQCVNIEGFQEVVPEGYYQTKGEQGYECYPDEGEPTPTPTPSPEPEQPRTVSSGGGSASAPVCSDGSTIKLPANPHVLRSGSDATVNWFQTEADEANIYYKEVNEANWTHSVRDIKVPTDNNPERFVSVTIHDLDPKLGYTFGIQQKHGCGGGETVIAVIVDGPTTQLFQFSYWEWGR